MPLYPETLIFSPATIERGQELAAMSEEELDALIAKDELEGWDAPAEEEEAQE